MSKHITAWSVDTGRKQFVPAHFRDNPKLASGLVFEDPALAASAFPVDEESAAENTDPSSDEPTTTITPQAGDIDNKE